MTGQKLQWAGSMCAKNYTYIIYTYIYYIYRIEKYKTDLNFPSCAITQFLDPPLDARNRLGGWNDGYVNGPDWNARNRLGGCNNG